MKQKNRTKKNLLISIVILLWVLCAVISAAGCGPGSKEVLTEDVMIPNSEGTFTKAQITVPADYETEKLPAVVLSHGFHGTMNSAGMKDLAYALAENGIAAIRMNFSHNLSENPDSRQTNRYTVETMVSDQVLCARYMTEHYNIDSQKIGVFGRSLGGRAAMTLVNESAGGYDYKALVLVAPAGNQDAFQRYMGGDAKWEKFKREADEKGSVTYQGVVMTPSFFKNIEEYVPTETAYKYEHPVLVLYNTEDNVVLPEAAVECANSYKDHRLIEITSKKSPHGLEMGMKDSEIREMLFKDIIAFYQKNLV